MASGLKTLIPFLLWAVPLSANDTFSLTWPLDCEPGKNCWITRFVDRSPSGERLDHACGTRTQEGHKGTDISLANMGVMEKGVAVLTDADGIVTRLRNSEPDISIRQRGVDAVKGKDCGNGLVINHGNGWESQYCHLKKDSLTVKQGDSVKAGDTLAKVGLSGQTEYPHLHITLRHNGVITDPFDGGQFQKGCKSSEEKALWQVKLPYKPFEVIPPQLTVTPPTRETVWNAAPTIIKASAPALILTAKAFHAREGDLWHVVIRDPKGGIFVKKKIRQKKNNQFSYKYIGRRKPAGGFEPGLWSGSITLTRTKENGETTSLTRETKVSIVSD